MKDDSRQFATQIKVSHEHIDVQGHVCNVTIVALLNRATLAHAESLGWDAAAYRKLGGMFVVRRHEIDYRNMAFLDDVLRLETWVVAMEKARAERRHRIVRAADGVIIAESVNYWTYVDMTTGRPQRFPDVVVEAFCPKAAR
jgi:acyl-CoA thioester hydrolase